MGVASTLPKTYAIGRRRKSCICFGGLFTPNNNTPFSQTSYNRSKTQHALFQSISAAARNEELTHRCAATRCDGPGWRDIRGVTSPQGRGEDALQLYRFRAPSLSWCESCLQLFRNYCLREHKCCLKLSLLKKKNVVQFPCFCPNEKLSFCNWTIETFTLNKCYSSSPFCVQTICSTSPSFHSGDLFLKKSNGAAPFSAVFAVSVFSRGRRTVSTKKVLEKDILLCVLASLLFHMYRSLWKLNRQTGLRALLLQPKHVFRHVCCTWALKKHHDLMFLQTTRSMSMQSAANNKGTPQHTDNFVWFGEI